MQRSWLWSYASQTVSHSTLCCAGTARLQLGRKGDATHTYAKLVNVVISLGFLAVPLQGWLVDRQGYAITLIVINVLGVACALLQVC